MRRLVIALAAVSLVASCKLQKLASVVSFEGEIDMSTSTGIGVGPAAMTTTIKIKGAKMRTDTATLGGFASITDGDAKKMWTINPAARTYTETDLSAATKATSTIKSTMKAVKTGRSDKVAGYACDVYELVDSSAPASSPPIELCIASGLGMMALGLSGPFATFANGSDAWGELMSHGFPLRMTMRDLGGKPIVSMEATRIERKSEPDSEFEVPAGYTKTASPI